MNEKEPLLYRNKSKNFFLWNWNRMLDIPFTFFEIKITNKEFSLVLLNFEIGIGNRYSHKIGEKK